MAREDGGCDEVRRARRRRHRRSSRACATSISELTKRVAHLTRKRPRSETLERLERQLVLPLMGLVAPGAKPAAAGGAEHAIEKRSDATAVGAEARSPPTSRASKCRISVPAIAADLSVVRQGNEDDRALGVRDHQRSPGTDLHRAPPRRNRRVSRPTTRSSPPCRHPRSSSAESSAIPSSSRRPATSTSSTSPSSDSARASSRDGVEIAPQTLGRSVDAHIDLLDARGGPHRGADSRPGLPRHGRDRHSRARSERRRGDPLRSHVVLDQRAMGQLLLLGARRRPERARFPRRPVAAPFSATARASPTASSAPAASARAA